MNLETLINQACPDLREITFHSDGRVIARTGGRAKNPKKLYTGKGEGKTWSEKAEEAISKLIKDQQ